MKDLSMGRPGSDVTKPGGSVEIRTKAMADISKPDPMLYFYTEGVSAVTNAGGWPALTNSKTPSIGGGEGA